MKANRKTMLGVALAVAVIALAGIGYAVGYTAYTESSGNKIASEYVTLTIDGEDNEGTAFIAYTGGQVSLEYNTETYYDSGVKTKYQLKATEPQEFTININAVNSTGATTQNYKLVIGGLSDLSTDAYDAAWECNGVAMVGSSITLESETLATIDTASLVLTITPKTTGSPAANVWITSAPAAVINIPTITFTLTNLD